MFSREADVYKQGIELPFGSGVGAKEREGRKKNNLSLFGELRGIEIADNPFQILRLINDVIDDTDHPSHLDVPPRNSDR